MAYILRHGAKENLVRSPRLWPGVHCVDALLTGEPLRGYWFDRTKESAARRRGEAFSRYDFATPETIVLSPLPCWRHLTPEEYCHRIADLVHQVEAEAERDRQQGGREPLGAEGVKAQNPREAPARSKRSPAPDFHAATKSALRALRDDFREFVAEYREASVEFRAGDRLAQFPAGSFPPPITFPAARPSGSRAPLCLPPGIEEGLDLRSRERTAIEPDIIDKACEETTGR